MQIQQRSTKQEVLQLQRNWQSYFTLCEEKKLSFTNSRMQQLPTYSKGKGILKSVTIIEASLYCQLLGRSLLGYYWIDWMNILNSQGFYQKARWIQERQRNNSHDLYSTTASRKMPEPECGPLHAFVDHTKAFVTVSREGLWKIMAKVGCPAKFIANS